MQALASNHEEEMKALVLDIVDEQAEVVVKQATEVRNVYCMPSIHVADSVLFEGIFQP